MKSPNKKVSTVSHIERAKRALQAASPGTLETGSGQSEIEKTRIEKVASNTFTLPLPAFYGSWPPAAEPGAATSEDGDRKPASDWVALLYGDLRRAASRYVRHDGSATFDPTGLVHEAYLQLGGKERLSQAQFLYSICTAMRRLLMEAARRRKAVNRTFVELPGLGHTDPAEDAVALYEALEDLEARYPQSALVATLNKVAGFSLEEIAERLGVPQVKVREEWDFAKSFLANHIKPARHYT